MKYRDGSPYHDNIPVPLPDVLNVGWLSDDHFARKKASPAFVSKLWAIVLRDYVNQVRSIQPCRVCGTDDVRFVHDGVERLLGTCEVWVPAADRTVIYASPDLIIHYVRDHDYLPPVGFVEAVEAFHLDGNWSGSDEAASRIDKVYE